MVYIRRGFAENFVPAPRMEFAKKKNSTSGILREQRPVCGAVKAGFAHGRIVSWEPFEGVVPRGSPQRRWETHHPVGLLYIVIRAGARYKNVAPRQCGAERAVDRLLDQDHVARRENHVNVV